MCAFVDKHRDEHGVEPICKTLQIGPSTYYARPSRPESARGLALGNRLDGPVQPDLPTAGKDLTGRPAPRQPRTTVEHHRQRGRTIRPAQIPPRPAPVRFMELPVTARYPKVIPLECIREAEDVGPAGDFSSQLQGRFD